MVVRGMIFRQDVSGSSHQTGAVGDTARAMESVERYVIEPLEELGFGVILYVDVVCPEDRQREAQDRSLRCESVGLVFFCCK